MSHNLLIGSSGAGQLTISGGGTVDCGSVFIGNLAGSSGDVAISGTGSTLNTNGSFNVGNSGAGTLTIATSGTLNTMGGITAIIGSGGSSTGTVMMSGSGSKWNAEGGILVGSVGTGNLIVQSGATINTLGSLTVTNLTGTLTIDGGTIDVGSTLARNGTFNFNDGTLIVRGIFDNGIASVPLVIDGDTTTALPTLQLIGNSATTEVTSITVGNKRQGAMVLSDGRSVNAGANNISIGAGAGSSGSITLGGAGTSLSTTGTTTVGGSGSNAGGTGVMTIGPGAGLSTGSLILFPGGTVNLDGGVIFMSIFSANGGKVNFNSGTIGFTVANLSAAHLDALLGADHSLGFGKVLTSSNATALLGPVTVNGGSLSTGTSLTNSSALVVSGGTVTANTTITNDIGRLLQISSTGSVSGVSGINNNGTIELINNSIATSGGTLTNNGAIRGTGLIGNNLTNSATGQVQLSTGNRLEFQGATNTNNGLVSLTGGEAVFTGALTNSANTGLISGRDAILRFNGTLTNNGSLAFSNGTMDVFGDITSNHFVNSSDRSRITVSAGGTANFYDDVTVAPGQTDIQLSAAGSIVSSAVFFGSYNGGSVGGGTAFIEGDHRPGNSPATVSFGGDVAYGGLSRLLVEIGGATAGTQYDQVHVTGQLSLGGALNVSLINGFSPMAGDSFDILDWGTRSGTFSSVQLPVLDSGPLGWDTSQLYIDGKLIVTPFVPGDFNRDGQVTSADVPAMLLALTDLNAYTSTNSLNPTQLAAIGDFDGSGTVTNHDIQGLLDLVATLGGGSAVAVPEPATLVLLSIGALVIFKRKQHR